MYNGVMEVFPHKLCWKLPIWPLQCKYGMKSIKTKATGMFVIIQQNRKLLIWHLDINANEHGNNLLRSLYIHAVIPVSIVLVKVKYFDKYIPKITAFTKIFGKVRVGNMLNIKCDIFSTCWKKIFNSVEIFGLKTYLFFYKLQYYTSNTKFIQNHDKVDWTGRSKLIHFLLTWYNILHCIKNVDLICPLFIFIQW
jgi:hypothetical protein